MEIVGESRSEDDSARAAELETELRVVRASLEKMAEMCSRLLKHVDSLEPLGTSANDLEKKVCQL